MARLAPGTMVGTNVRLLRHLGEGGMGSVWVGEHLALEIEVAVKFISAELPEKHRPMLVKRFYREAKAAAKIKSPHVVEIKDLGVMRGGVPFIIMELLEGASLGERLARCCKLGLHEAALVVRQVARALDAAHERGVVHRDIKPDNVFLVASHDEILVKVLDFGVAKLADVPQGGSGLTAHGVLLGTPRYMSPELLKSAREADHTADLWALAVLVYEMVTGRLPFVAETVPALFAAIIVGTFLPPSQIDPGLPAALDTWFGRALCREPGGRFASAKEMALAFARAVGTAGLGLPSELLGSGEHGRAWPELDAVEERGAQRSDRPAGMPRRVPGEPAARAGPVHVAEPALDQTEPPEPAEGLVTLGLPRPPAPEPGALAAGSEPTESVEALADVRVLIEPVLDELTAEAGGLRLRARPA
ncbi:MAG: protein kinase [Deltaproteobacteria bacterium]|nr:protein kinase [Deltaproteobacteria bacterium]